MFSFFFLTPLYDFTSLSFLTICCEFIELASGSMIDLFLAFQSCTKHKILFSLSPAGFKLLSWKVSTSLLETEIDTSLSFITSERENVFAVDGDLVEEGDSLDTIECSSYKI